MQSRNIRFVQNKGITIYFDENVLDLLVPKEIEEEKLLRQISASIDSGFLRNQQCEITSVIYISRIYKKTNTENEYHILFVDSAEKSTLPILVIRNAPIKINMKLSIPYKLQSIDIEDLLPPNDFTPSTRDIYHSMKNSFIKKIKEEIKETIFNTAPAFSKIVKPHDYVHITEENQHSYQNLLAKRLELNIDETNKLNQLLSNQLPPKSHAQQELENYIDIKNRLSALNMLEDGLQTEQKEYFKNHISPQINRLTDQYTKINKELLDLSSTQQEEIIAQKTLLQNISQNLNQQLKKVDYKNADYFIPYIKKQLLLNLYQLVSDYIRANWKHLAEEKNRQIFNGLFFSIASINDIGQITPITVLYEKESLSLTDLMADIKSWINHLPSKATKDKQPLQDFMIKKIIEALSHLNTNSEKKLGYKPFTITEDQKNFDFSAELKVQENELEHLSSQPIKEILMAYQPTEPAALKAALKINCQQLQKNIAQLEQNLQLFTSLVSEKIQLEQIAASVNLLKSAFEKDDIHSHTAQINKKICGLVSHKIIDAKLKQLIVIKINELTDASQSALDTAYGDFQNTLNQFHTAFQTIKQKARISKDDLEQLQQLTKLADTQYTKIKHLPDEAQKNIARLTNLHKTLDISHYCDKIIEECYKSIHFHNETLDAKISKVQETQDHIAKLHDNLSDEIPELKSTIKNYLSTKQKDLFAEKARLEKTLARNQKHKEQQSLSVQVSQNKNRYAQHSSDDPIAITHESPPLYSRPSFLKRHWRKIAMGALITGTLLLAGTAICVGFGLPLIPIAGIVTAGLLKAGVAGGIASWLGIGAASAATLATSGAVGGMIGAITGVVSGIIADKCCTSNATLISTSSTIELTNDPQPLSYNGNGSSTGTFLRQMPSNSDSRRDNTHDVEIRPLPEDQSEANYRHINLQALPKGDHSTSQAFGRRPY